VVTLTSLHHDAIAVSPHLLQLDEATAVVVPTRLRVAKGLENGSRECQLTLDLARRR
jgi:hypothetical protein